MAYNKEKALMANVYAIETAMSLHKNGLRPTDAQKAVLYEYSGFGGIKDILNIGTDKPIPEEIAELLLKLQEIIANYPGFSDATKRNNAVYDNLKRGQIIIKKGATADAAKLTK